MDVSALKLLGVCLCFIVSLTLASCSGCNRKNVGAELEGEDDIVANEGEVTEKAVKKPISLEEIFELGTVPEDKKLGAKSELSELDRNIEELKALNPTTDSDRIEVIAGNLRLFEDEGLIKLAESYETSKTFKEELTFALAMNFINSDVAWRYIPLLMDKYKTVDLETKTADFDAIMKLVKSRDGGDTYLADILAAGLKPGGELCKKVINAIADYGTDDASEALYNFALSDKDAFPDVIVAMGKIETDKNVERLVEFLYNPAYKQYQDILINAIQKRRDTACDYLIDGVEDSPDEERMDRLNAYGRIGGEKCLEELSYFYSRYASSDLTNDEKIKVLNLVRMNPDISRDAAEEALLDEDEGIRRTALAMLRDIGDSRALIAIQAYEDAQKAEEPIVVIESEKEEGEENPEGEKVPEGEENRAGQGE